ncbi:hypothetical protein M0813_09440 [Anaeramoeba flamelloides]|uniref:Uncharacterized protein n=1 Tax=Anaeramoeba flamelloides TaxID=1746091 RepID=A0ABQ8X5U6_9EUKA|nr:hypothetical protein M0813_09440 [Anaeramoeba flamelloides]
MSVTQKSNATDIISELEKNLALLNDLTKEFENNRSSDSFEQKTKKKISPNNKGKYFKKQRLYQRKKKSPLPFSSTVSLNTTAIRRSSNNKKPTPKTKILFPEKKTKTRTRTRTRMKSYYFNNPKVYSKLNKPRLTNKGSSTRIHKRKNRSKTLNQKINHKTKEDFDQLDGLLRILSQSTQRRKTRKTNDRATKKREGVASNTTTKRELSKKKSPKLQKFKSSLQKNLDQIKSQKENEHESESDEDLEIDSNFTQIVSLLKSPKKKKYFSRKNKKKLKFLDKNTKRKVLKHKEFKEEENINLNEFPDFKNNGTIEKISQFTGPKQPKDRIKEFEKFISQFELDSCSGDTNISKHQTKTVGNTKNNFKKKIDPKEIELKLSKFKEKEEKRLENKQKKKKTSQIINTKKKKKKKNSDENDDTNVFTEKTDTSSTHSDHTNDLEPKAKTRRELKGITLITHDSIKDLPHVQGKMKYNTETCEWEGNDEELEAFERQIKGGFIPNTVSSMTYIEYNDMKYNPLTHTWEGNEEDINWGNDDEERAFLKSIERGDKLKNAHSDSQKRYHIGKTFKLNEKTIKKFNSSEDLNNKLIKKWKIDENLKEKTFLIRKVALIWMIESGKKIK